MPNVNGKSYPYTQEGKKAAKEAMATQKKKEAMKPFGTSAPKAQQTAMGKAYNAAQKSAAKPMAVSPKPPKPMAPATKTPKAMPMAPKPMPKKKGK